jgi:hypothetical protein
VENEKIRDCFDQTLMETLGSLFYIQENCKDILKLGGYLENV